MDEVDDSCFQRVFVRSAVFYLAGSVSLCFAVTCGFLLQRR